MYMMSFFSENLTSHRSSDSKMSFPDSMVSSILFDSWSGSKIPMLNERVKYLENLKQRINEPKYLMHRIIIDDCIEFYRRDTRETEIRELMEGWD